MLIRHRHPAFWNTRGRIPISHLAQLEVDVQNPLARGLLAFWLLGFNRRVANSGLSTTTAWWDLSPNRIQGTDDSSGPTLTRSTDLVGPSAVFNGTTGRFSSADSANSKFNVANATFIAGIVCTTLVQFGMIGAQWNETGNKRRWSLNINSTSGDLRADTSANGTTIAVTATTPTGVLVANKRTVVGSVMNGTGNSDVGQGLQIFVDGDAKGSLGSYSSALANIDTNFTTGFSPQWGSSGRFFTGHVDFTAMWGRPLNHSEMRQIMADPFSILRPRAPQMAARKMAAGGGGGSTQQSAVTIIF